MEFENRQLPQREWEWHKHYPRESNSLTGEKISYAFRLEFPALNNEVEYKALLARLRLAKEMRAEQLRIYSDSQLVINQVNGDYQAKSENMVTYLKKARGQLMTFKWYRIEQVPITKNVKADSLARLASGLEDGTLGRVPIETLVEPSTKESVNHVMCTDPSPSWIYPIFDFLAEGKVPEDKNEARRIRY